MNKGNLELYFVAGPQDFPDLSLVEAEKRMATIIASGVTTYQFRDKGTQYGDAEQRLALAKRLQQVAQTHGVAFVVDDDVELALALGADGLHVGQDDQPVASLATRLPADMWLGLSASTPAEIRAAKHPRIDYLGVGPVLPTQSKRDAKAPTGTAGLRNLYANRQRDLPIVAIGGITLAAIPAIKAAGAAGVAVISLLTQSPEPSRTVQAMKERWHADS
ncbi:thiamine phosphate synthase [Pediococcus pentosaceus]|uniref:thiamine phosphate synthase n=1 Tax=Pediococcus pentosaceus TaxID=1255 RepID=UPI003981C61D